MVSRAFDSSSAAICGRPDIMSRADMLGTEWRGHGHSDRSVKELAERCYDA